MVLGVEDFAPTMNNWSSSASLVDLSLVDTHFVLWDTGLRENVLFIDAFFML